MVLFLLPIETKKFCLFREMEKMTVSSGDWTLIFKRFNTERDRSWVKWSSWHICCCVFNFCNWVNEFKRGRTSTKDEHRSGRPVKVTTPEMIDKIYDMVLSWGYFSDFPSQFWRAIASIHNCWRNMDTLLHSRDKGTVKTMGFWRRTGSEKGEEGTIGW